MYYCMQDLFILCCILFYFSWPHSCSVEFYIPLQYQTNFTCYMRFKSISSPVITCNHLSLFAQAMVSLQSALLQIFLLHLADFVFVMTLTLFTDVLLSVDLAFCFLFYSNALCTGMVLGSAWFLQTTHRFFSRGFFKRLKSGQVSYSLHSISKNRVRYILSKDNRFEEVNVNKL